MLKVSIWIFSFNWGFKWIYQFSNDSSNFNIYWEFQHQWWVGPTERLSVAFLSQTDWSEAPAKPTSIAWQIFWVLIVKHAYMCGHCNKHCLTSTFCLSMLLKLLKNIFACHKHKRLPSSCLWSGQTNEHCAWQGKFQMIPKQCLFVWPELDSEFFFENWNFMVHSIVWGNLLILRQNKNAKKLQKVYKVWPGLFEWWRKNKTFLDLSFYMCQLGLLN